VYIKNKIRSNLPIFIISKLYSYYPTHHRLVIGYDERTKVLFVHDPWTLDVERSWLDVQWAHNDYTVATVEPIKVNLEIETGPVSEAGNFTLKCTINNGFMSNVKDIRLEINLPSGYSLLNGTSTIDLTSIRGEVTRAWKIDCPTPRSSHKIAVKAKTFNGLVSYGGIGRIFPAHPQAFIYNVTSNYINDTAPYKADISAIVNCTGGITASLNCFSLPPNTGGEGISTSYTDVTFETDSTIKCETGPNQPDWLVYCWFELQTIYGNQLSRTLVIDTYDSDSDSDGISDFDEETIYFTNPLSNDSDFDKLSDYSEIFDYGTNPNNSDTDGDGMNDFDEIAQGYDPLDPRSNLLMKNLILTLSISLPIIAVVAITLTIFLVIKRKKKIVKEN
jgi:hypothetical protein